MKNLTKEKFNLKKFLVAGMLSLQVFLYTPLTLMATLPSGENVQSGTAGFSRTATSLDVNASNKVIIDWNDFSIGTGNVTSFVHSGSNGASLNRVVGGNLSNIAGTLNSNGSVYLINPNGVLVGPSGVIDTQGSFVASTLDLDNADFLAGGDLTFAGSSGEKVINLGSITSDAGDILLIARQVENSGPLTAHTGTVGLAAGSEVLLKVVGDERIFVQPPLENVGGTGVDNTGPIEALTAELKAASHLYELAINSGGTIAATGATSTDGRVYLIGGAIEVNAPITAGGAVVSASSPLTIGSDFIIGGDFTFTATDSAAAGDDLTVNPGVTVQSTGGSLTMRGGDNVIFGAGSLVDAFTTLTIEGDFGDADAGVGSTMTFNGTISSGSGTTIIGEADDDVINLNQSSSANVNGGGGDDTLVIADGVTLTGNFDGQGGTGNAIDLSNYSTQVDTVLTGAGSSSGFAGGFNGTPDPLVGTFDNVNDITASASGSDEFTGTAADDTFTIDVTGTTFTSGANSLSITGVVDFFGGDGDDTLVIDTTGAVVLPAAISFDGQGQTTSPNGDTVSLAGDDTFATITHTFTNASDGNIVLGGTTITYAGLEPIIDNMSATNRVFTFTGGAETITLANNAAAGSSEIDSTLGESVVFVNPTASITINSGTGNDTIDVNGLDVAYGGSLTINGTGTTTDVVDLALTGVTLSALTVDTTGGGATGGAIGDDGDITVTGVATFDSGGANTIINGLNNSYGSIDVTAATALIRETNATQIDALTTTGGASILSGGAITDTGNISVGGVATFNANAGAANITLNSGTNDFSSFSVIGDQVTVVENSASDIFTSTVGDFFNLTSGGAVVDSGAISVTNLFTINANAGASDITLDLGLGSHSYGSLNLTGNNIDVGESDNTDLAAVSAGGSFTMTSAGTIDDSGAISVTGAATFITRNNAGRAITLDEGTGTFGNLTVRARNAAGGADAAGAIDVTENAAMTLLEASSTSTIALTSTAGIELGTGGAAGVSAGSTVTLTAGGAGSITDGNAASQNVVATSLVVLGNRPVTDIETTVSNLALTSAATSITNTGALTVNNSTVTGQLDLTNDNNILMDNVNAAGQNANIQTTGGSINDNNGVALNLTASNANLDATTGIGNTADLELAATTITADTTAGNIDLDNTTAANAQVNSLTTNGGTVTFIQNGGGEVSFASVTSGNPAAGGTILLQNTADLLNVDAAGTVSSATGAGATLNIIDGVVIGAGATVEALGADVTLQGVSATGDMTIGNTNIGGLNVNFAAPRDIIVNGTLTSTLTGTLGFQADNDGDNVGGFTIVAAGEVSGTGNMTASGHDLFASGGIARDGINIANDGANFQISMAGTVTLDNGGAGSTAADDVLVLGNVRSTGAADIDFNANDVIGLGATVFTGPAGTVTFNDAVELQSAVDGDVTGGTVTFLGNVTDPGVANNLTILSTASDFVTTAVSLTVQGITDVTAFDGAATRFNITMDNVGNDFADFHFDGVNVTMVDSNAVIIGDPSIDASVDATGTLSLTALGGTLTQDAAVDIEMTDVSQTTTLVAFDGGVTYFDLTLNNAGNTLGQIDVTGDNVNLREDDHMFLITGTVNTNLTARVPNGFTDRAGRGDFTQTDGILVNGTSLFIMDGLTPDVHMNYTGNTFTGTVTVQSLNAGTNFRSVDIGNRVGTVLADAGGSLDATNFVYVVSNGTISTGTTTTPVMSLYSQGAITQTGPFTVTQMHVGTTANDVLPGSDVTLNNAGNDFDTWRLFGGVATNSNNVVLVDTDDIQVSGVDTAGSFTLTAGGDVTIGAATTTTLDVTTTGNIFQNGLLTSGGAATFETSLAGADIKLGGSGSTANTFGGGVTITNTGASIDEFELSMNGNNFTILQGPGVPLTNFRTLTLDLPTVPGILLMPTWNVTEDLTIESSGGIIAQAGGNALTIGGTATFRPGPTRNVILNEDNDFNLVKIVNESIPLTAANTISINDVNDLSIIANVTDSATVTVTNDAYIGLTTGAGAVSVTSTNGNISQIGQINVATGATFSTSGLNAQIALPGWNGSANTVGGALTIGGLGADIDYLNLNSSFGTLTLTPTTFGTVELTVPGAIALPEMTLDDNLTVNAGGAITQTAALVVPGEATFRAGAGNNVILTNAGNNFNTVNLIDQTTGLAQANDLTIVDQDAFQVIGNITGTATISNAAGDIGVGITAGGAINVTGTANIHQAGPMSAGAASLFSTSSATADVLLDGFGGTNTFTGGVTIRGTTGTLRDVELSTNGNAITFDTGGGALTNFRNLTLDLPTLPGVFLIPTLNVTENLYIDSAGGVLAQAGGNTITVGGTATLLPGPTRNLILNEDNDFNLVKVFGSPEANIVSINDVNDISIIADVTDSVTIVVAGDAYVGLTTGGAASVTSATGNISQIGPINVGTAATFSTSGVGVEIALPGWNGSPNTVGTTLTIGGLGADIDYLNVDSSFTTLTITPILFGDAEINGTGAVALSEMTMRGNLTVNTGGPITQSAALVVPGTATFRAGAGNDITLNNAGNDFNLVNVTDPSGVDQANNLTIVDTNAVSVLADIAGIATISNAAGDLGVGITAGGALSVTGTANISQIGPMSSGGAALFSTTSATGNVFLEGFGGAANTFTGGVTVRGTAGSLNDVELRANGGNVTFDTGGGSLTNFRNVTLNLPTLGGAFTLPTMNVTADLNVTSAGGALGQAANTLTVGGKTTLRAGAGNNINLPNANDFNLLEITDPTTPTQGNTVTIVDANGINVIADVATSVTITAGGDAGVGLTSGGSATVTAAGSIGQIGTLNVTTNASFTTSVAGSDIVLSDPNNTVGGTLTINDGGVGVGLLDIDSTFTTLTITATTFEDVTIDTAAAIALPAMTITDSLSVIAGGPITQGGALTVGGSATFRAGAGNDITLSNGGNDFATVNVTDPSTGLAQADNLTITDSNGMNVNANVTTAATISSTAGNIGVGVTAGGAISVTGAGNISQIGAISAGAASIFSSSSATGDVILDGFGGANTFTGGVTVRGTAGSLDELEMHMNGNSLTLDTGGGALTNFRNVKLTLPTLPGIFFMPTLNITDDLIVDSSGGILVQIGPNTMTVGGTATFRPGPTRNAIFNNNNDFNLVKVVSATAPTTQANIVSITDVNDISIIADVTDSVVLNAAGDANVGLTSGNVVTITSGADISQIGPINVAAAATFSTSGLNAELSLPGWNGAGNTVGTTLTVGGLGANIDYLNLNFAFGALNITPISFGTVEITTPGAIALSEMTVADNLTVNAGGAVTQTAQLVVPGEATFRAGAGNNVVLNNAANNFNKVNLTDATTGLAQANNLTLVDVDGVEVIANVAGGATISNAAGDIGVGVIAGGAINVTGTANIYQAGPMTGGAASLFSTSSATGDVLLEGFGGTVNTFTGGVTVRGTTGTLRDVELGMNGSNFTFDTGGGSLTNFRNLTLNLPATGGAFTLPTLNVTDELTVISAGGAMGQGANTLTVGGTARLRAGAGNNINLPNANDFNLVDVTAPAGGAQADTLTLTDANAISVLANVATSAIITAGGDANVGLTSGGTVNVTAAGSIGQIGTLTTVGDATFTTSVAGSDIILDDPNNSVGGTLIINDGGVGLGALRLDSTFTGLTLNPTSFGDFEITTAGAFAIPAVTVTDSIVVNAGGDITQTAALTVPGTATFRAGAGNDVTLSNAGNDFNIVNVTSPAGGAQANNLTLVDTNGVTVNANVTTNATITAGGDASVGLTSGGAVAVTAAGSIGQSGTLTAGTNATFTTSVAGSDIILDDPANTVGGTLTINDGGVGLGDLIVNSTFTTLTINPTTFDNVELTTAAAIALPAMTISDSLVVNAGGAITQGAALTVGGEATFRAGAGNNVVLSNAGNNFNQVNVTGTGGAQANDLTVVDTNDVEVVANVAGTATITSTGGDIGLGVVAGAALNVTGTADIHQVGPTSSVGAALLISSSATGNVTLEGIGGTANTFTGGLTVRGTAGSLGDVEVNMNGNNITFDTGGGALTNFRNLTLDLPTLPGVFLIPTLNITENLQIDSAGGLYAQAGGNTITVAGTATFRPGSTRNVILNEDNDFNLVKVVGTTTPTQANIVQINDINDMSIIADVTDSVTLAIGGDAFVGLTSGNVISVNAAGDISQIGPITAVGSATFSTSGIGVEMSLPGWNGNPNTVGGTLTIGGLGADIDYLNLNSTFAGGLTITPTIFGSAEINSPGAIALPQMTLRDSLTIISGGPVTQTAALTVPGILTVRAGAGNDVTLSNVGNDFNRVSVLDATTGLAQANNLTIVDANSVEVSGNVAGAATVTASAGNVGISMVSGGALTVNSTADISQIGALTAGAASSFTTTSANGEIILDGAGGAANTFTGGVTITGSGGSLDRLDLAMNGQNFTLEQAPATPLTNFGTLNLTLPTLGGNINFGNFTVTGDMSIVSDGGNLLQGGGQIFTVGGTARIKASSTRNVFFNNANDFNRVEIFDPITPTQANIVFLTDTNDVEVVADVTQNITINAGGDANVGITAGNVAGVTTSGSISQIGVINTGGSATFTTSGANVDIELDGFGNVTNTVGGTLTVGNIAATIRDLDINSSFANLALTPINYKLVNITSPGAVPLQHLQISDSITVNAGGDITQATGPLVVGGTATFRVGAGNDITLTHGTNNLNRVFVTAPGGGAQANNLQILDINDVEVTANVANNATITATAGEASLAVVAGGGLTVTGQSIGQHGLTSSTGAAVFQATGGAANGHIILNGNAGAGNVFGGGATINGATMGDLTYFGAGAGSNVTINPTNLGNVRITVDAAFALSAMTLTGNLDVITSGVGSHITQTGALVIAGNATFNAGDAANNDITLNNAGNNFDKISFNSVRDVIANDLDDVTVFNTTTGNDLTVTSGGTIFCQLPIVVGGTQSFVCP